MGGARVFSKRFIIAFLSFSLVSVGLYSFFGSNGLMEIFRRKKIEDDLKVKLETLKKENIVLRSKIWGLKNQQHEMERIAREELLLIKPGEKLFIVEEDER